MPLALVMALTRTPVRRGGLRWGDCIYCGHALHTINGGVCNVIISDIAGEVVLCTCERNPMADRQLQALAFLTDDQLTLPDENGVETAYTIDRIEGTQFESKIYLKQANGVPGPEKILTYRRVD